MLLGLLDAAIAQGGFLTADGQVLKLESKEPGEKSGKSSKSQKAKDPRDGHYKYDFDLDQTLTAVNGISVRLVVSAVDASGNAAEPVETALPTGAQPAAKLALAQQSLPESSELGNFPNPFNPSTTIHYTVSEAAEVRLAIYSVLGQKVSDLVDDHHQPRRYNVVWNSRTASGQQVAAGLYIYRLQVG